MVADSPSRRSSTTASSSPAGRIVVVAGPPGAGKGTQCAKLAQRFGLLHLSTGDIFRDAVARGTDLGQRAQEYVARRDFVPDELVLELLRERMAEVDGAGVLLDGFPRSAEQARVLTTTFDVERFVLLQVPDEACVSRVRERREDPETGDLYHLTFCPPDSAVAPRLVTREADLDETAVRARLRWYHAHLGRVLPYFRGQIQPVNGARDVATVYAEMELLLAGPAPRPEETPVGPRGPVPAANAATCSICLTEPADFLCAPCGHQCGCEGCLTTVQRQGGRCPICRAPIQSLVRVFRVGEGDAELLPELAAPVLPVEDDGGWGEDVEEEPSQGDCDLTLVAAPADDEAATHVCVSVRVPEGVRKPVDVCCVVDISGSMGTIAKYEGEDGTMRDDGLSLLDVVKHAVKTVIHTLGDEDRLALVAFDHRADTAFALAEMTPAGRTQALAALQGLAPRGQTNLWGGLQAGLDALRAPDRDGAERTKSLLLLTDGQPNVAPPRGHTQELRDYLDAHPDLSAGVNTFGFGYSLDSELLLDLATIGGGSYSFIPDALIVGTVFVNSVANALTTRASTATLHLTPKNGAEFRGEVLGEYPVTETSWGRVVKVGPLQYGQSRDVVVPMTLPAAGATGPGYLDVVLEVPDRQGKTTRAALSCCERNSSVDSVAALARSSAASGVLGAVRDAQSSRGQAANRTVATLAGQVTGQAAAVNLAAPGSAAATALAKLEEDVAGRVTKALSTKERFHRWGKHYLRALARAHQLQQNTNYMDPGLQVYGGCEFRVLRDAGGEIFQNLPAPTRSNATRTTNASRPSVSSASGGAAALNTQGTVLMATYYAGGGGGCFGGASTLLVRDGDGFRATRADAIRAGDEVAVSDGTAVVQCVARLARPGELVRLAETCWITPRHPVRIGWRTWRRPSELLSAVWEPNPSGVVFNFLLDRPAPALVVGGVECVAWGHELTEDGAAHEFYGSRAAVLAALAAAGAMDGEVDIPTASLRAYTSSVRMATEPMATLADAPCQVVT